MKKEHILGALLLASWTVNVALIVAWFFQRSYPEGVVYNSLPPEALAPQPPLPPPFMLDGEFRGRNAALHGRRLELTAQLAEAFAADRLDTGRVLALSDSLATVRSGMQRELISRAIAVHGQLEVHERRELFRHALRGMEGDSTRRRGGRFAPEAPGTVSPR